MHRIGAALLRHSDDTGTIKIALGWFREAEEIGFIGEAYVPRGLIGFRVDGYRAYT